MRTPWFVITVGMAGAVGLLSAPATAQTVYRCGSSYSQAPCADPANGTRQVDVADPRTPEQARAAREVATRDSQAAQALQREREARERREREAETARLRASAQALTQARLAERAAQAERARQDHGREVIVVPRRSPASAAGPKPFTAVAPPPAKSASATAGRH